MVGMIIGVAELTAKSGIGTGSELVVAERWRRGVGAFVQGENKGS